MQILSKYAVNHLLFGRQLLYYSNTASAVVRNLTVLSSTAKIKSSSNFGIGETWICSKFTWDTTNMKIRYKLPKNYVVLVYDEKVPWHFFHSIAIVTAVLLIKGAIVRIAKTNAILKRPIYKLFPIEYVYIMTLNKQIRQGNKS